MNMKVKLAIVAGEQNRIRERLAPLLGVHACVQTTAMPKAIFSDQNFPPDFFAAKPPAMNL